MEVEKVSKNKIIIKMPEYDEGMLNAVKDLLWKDSKTEKAAYQITHPLAGEAVFTFETKGDAIKLWNDAIISIGKEADEFKKLAMSLK